MNLVSNIGAVLMSLCALAAAASSANAQQLQAVPAGEHLTPIRAAVLNADMSIRGDWIDYRAALTQRGGVACSAIETLSYDCFQADTDGVTPIGADIDCGLESPDVRYRFAVDSCSQRTADDFTLETGFGDEITRITGSFYWYGNGNPINSEQCFIVVQIWDDIDSTCTGPAIDNFLGNVILDLGVLQNNSGVYFTFDIDVCLINEGVGIPAPIDGAGAVDLIFAQAFDPKLGQVTLATCAQPMLWGTGAFRPGSQQNLPYWSDDDQTFDFDPGTECFDFTGLAPCPDNFGTMVALYTASSDPCNGITPGDVNNDGLTSLLDATPMATLINSPAVPTADQLCRADLNADDLVDHFDQAPFVTILTGGPPAAAVSSQRGASPDITFFLAEDGLSNPADFDSAAVDPVRENPQVPYAGGSIQRLYIWSLHNADDLHCQGLSFNVQAIGGIVLNDLVIYDSQSGLGEAWISIENGAGAGQRWENTSATSILEWGLFTGIFQELPGLENPHVIDDIQLVGHIDYAGVGEIFLEVGHSGIIREGLDALPGPNVGLGFGDAPVSGSAYNTASTMADAVVICIGDLNGDNAVDAADLGILITEFGTPGVSADINGDGIVDAADLGVLIAQFGSSCSIF